MKRVYDYSEENINNNKKIKKSKKNVSSSRN